MTRPYGTDSLPPRPSQRPTFGPALTLGLAALAVPRVALHDLDVVGEGDAVNLVLVLAPLVAWIGAAVVARVQEPLRALVWVGATHGVLLAVTHQLLWERAFDGDPPRLGGNLEGELSVGAEELLLRAVSVLSSVGTGLAVGVLCGLVARFLLRRRSA